MNMYTLLKQFYLFISFKRKQYAYSFISIYVQNLYTCHRHINNIFGPSPFGDSIILQVLYSVIFCLTRANNPPCHKICCTRVCTIHFGYGVHSRTTFNDRKSAFLFIYYRTLRRKVYATLRNWGGYNAFLPRPKTRKQQ